MLEMVMMNKSNEKEELLIPMDAKSANGLGGLLILSTCMMFQCWSSSHLLAIPLPGLALRLQLLLVVSDLVPKVMKPKE